VQPALSRHLACAKAAIALGMELYFDGVLDEVAIFDYSFTAADVHLLYNASRTLDVDWSHPAPIFFGRKPGNSRILTHIFCSR
jgi:hypothetical protein